MQHSLAARVWLQLQRSNDLDHILREVLGDIAVLLMQDGHNLQNRNRFSILLCKLIFDYQRLCLNSSNPRQFTVIKAGSMLDVLTGLSRLASHLSQRWEQHPDPSLLSLVRGAFMSGIRALTLHPRRAGSEPTAADQIDACAQHWDTQQQLDSELTKPMISFAVSRLSGSSVTRPELVLDKADRQASQVV